MKPDVSIIIPSYGQKKTILKTIKSIYDNKTNLKYEVIVVDSSPEDYTDYIKAKFPKVKVIYSKKKLYSGGATNLGLKYAKADYILRTDTDVIVENKWINKLYKRLQKYDIVGGSVSNANPKSLIGWGIFLTEFSSFFRSHLIAHNKDLMSCNIGFTKKTLEKGLFPEHKASTDLYFTWKQKTNGAKLIFDPDINVKHINKTKINNVFKTQYRIGKYSAVARKKFNMPGNILVKIPILAFILPFYRFVTVFSRIIKEGLRETMIYLVLMPYIFIILFVYSIGFFIGAVSDE